METVKTGNSDIVMVPPILTKRRKFECETCKKSFTRRYALKCHRNNVHLSNKFFHPSSRDLKSQVTPFKPLGKTITKKAKKDNKDKLKRNKRIAEDMKKRHEERKLLKANVQQKKDINTLDPSIKKIGFMNKFFEHSIPEHKNVKKVTLEWDERDGINKVVVERIGRTEPKFSVWMEWDFMVHSGPHTKTFRSPSPNAIHAYNHYSVYGTKEMNQMNMVNF